MLGLKSLGDIEQAVGAGYLVSVFIEQAVGVASYLVSQSVSVLGLIMISVGVGYMVS